MKWVNENLLFIIWILSVVLFFAVYLWLRTMATEKRRKIIVTLSFLAAAILAFRIIFFTVLGYSDGGTALAWRKLIFALPGHLCGISAIVIPIAVLTRKKFLLDYTYFIALPASLFAFIFNSSVGVTSFIGDMETYIFWIPHLLYVILPIYLIAFDGVRPNMKSIPKVLLVLLSVLTIDHIINKVVSIAFNEYVVNYMYTMGPGDFIHLPGSGLLEKNFHTIGFLADFWNILPVEYWYMYLLIPLVIGVCLFMGLPFHVYAKIRPSNKG